MDFWTIVLVLLAIVLGFKVISSFLQPKFVPEPVAKFQVGDLTLQALRYYCGYDYMRPTLIAVQGKILDVTGSYDQYGPGKPLHIYAGQEISRALAKDSLAEDDLTNCLEDLTPEDLERLEAKTLELTGKYDLVGQVVAMKQMTLEQLAEHDGSSPGVPLLLSIQGTVYNITTGKQYYGPDGVYPFAGKEVARAFALLSTEISDCNDNIEGLSFIEMDNLKDWIGKFNSKYPVIGQIVKQLSSDSETEKPSSDPTPAVK